MSKMKKRSFQYLIHTAKEIESIPAVEAGAVSYAARVMATASFPYRDLPINEFNRSNGRSQLTILSPSWVGLPYGPIPRLLMIDIVTKSKIQKTRSIYLGKSSSELLKRLKKYDCGGPNGTRRSFFNQCKRLFSSSITVSTQCDNSWHVDNMHIARSGDLFWTPSDTNRWNAEILLDERFYADIQNHAIPIDLRAINALSHYPLAIDIYCWATYRNAFLKRPTVVRWEQLQNQFGNEISKLNNFKSKFLKAIATVQILYPALKWSIADNGLLIQPSKPHVSKSKPSSPFDTS